MDKILHDPKDPKLWELWYIPYYGSCRILSINRSWATGVWVQHKDPHTQLSFFRVFLGALDLLCPGELRLIWGFPKIGDRDPNIIPKIVGSLLFGSQNKVPRSETPI